MHEGDDWGNLGSGIAGDDGEEGLGEGREGEEGVLCHVETAGGEEEG